MEIGDQECRFQVMTLCHLVIARVSKIFDQLSQIRRHNIRITFIIVIFRLLSIMEIEPSR